MALRRTWIASPNYSARGAAVRLIVLHTAEGSRTFQSLGNYFKGNVGVSSHVGIDDTRGLIGEYVSRGAKAWTQANANPVSVAAELCGFARWTRSEWLTQHKNMLLNTADWIREEAARFGLPLVKLTPAQARGSGRGVCFHSDLGAWGGNHSDPGAGFPINEVMAWAKGSTPEPGPAPPPAPPPPTGPAPSWPYPGNHYLGQPSADPACHSGYYGGPDTGHVATWQRRMATRGWNIAADGKYGPQSTQVCRQFQREKNLAVDGLTGPKTWSAAWTAPIT